MCLGRHFKKQQRRQWTGPRQRWRCVRGADGRNGSRLRYSSVWVRVEVEESRRGREGEQSPYLTSHPWFGRHAQLNFINFTTDSDWTVEIYIFMCPSLTFSFIWVIFFCTLHKFLQLEKKREKIDLLFVLFIFVI